MCFIQVDGDGEIIHTRHNIRLDPIRKLPRPRRIDHRLHRTRPIRRHHMERPLDRPPIANLRECGTTLVHGTRHHSDSVLPILLRLPQTVGRDVGFPEDGGVDLCDAVFARPGDDPAEDTDGGAVAAGVAGDGGDFAVGGDESWGEGEGGEEEGGGGEVHGWEVVDGDWRWVGGGEKRSDYTG